MSKTSEKAGIKVRKGQTIFTMQDKFGVFATIKFPLQIRRINATINSQEV